MKKTDSPERISGLESHLGYWLRFVSNHVSHSFGRKMESVGVTVSEWVILREVLGFGAVSPTRLGDAIGMTKGAVSKLITRLEGKRLLTRSVSDADRRNHEVALTPAGKALVPRLARLADRNDEEFFGHLPVPLRTTLVDTLQDIVRVRQLKSKPVD